MQLIHTISSTGGEVFLFLSQRKTSYNWWITKKLGFTKMLTKHSIKILFGFVFFACALLFKVCYSGMARKDVHVVNIIEKNNSYPMETAVEDRFLNKISDFPSKGNQALETAGVFTGKEVDISIEDVLRHSSYFKLLGKSTLKNNKNDGIKKFWLRYDLENVSGEDLDFFLYSRDIFLKIDKHLLC